MYVHVYLIWKAGLKALNQEFSGFFKEKVHHFGFVMMQACEHAKQTIAREFGACPPGKVFKMCHAEYCYIEHIFC